LFFMVYKTCVFCNRNDSKPSREDILARWIAREFPNLSWEVTEIQSQKTFKTVANLGLISKKPCQRCNNGWMAKLEQTARPILVPMMDGQSVTLTPDAQHIVAGWFVKTIILYELLSDRLPYFQDYERHALMQSLRIPDRTLIFLARYYGPMPIATLETPVPLVIRPQPDTKGHPVSGDGYSATFIIKQLALQIFTSRPLEKRRLHVKIGPKWDNLSIQIWPTLGDTNWPPQYALDDDWLRRFIDRWGKVL
jgi:hypothetical protein